MNRSTKPGLLGIVCCEGERITKHFLYDCLWLRQLLMSLVTLRYDLEKTARASEIMRCGAVPNQSKSYVYIYIHRLCLYIYDNWEWHVEEPTMISKQNTPDGFCSTGTGPVDLVPGVAREMSQGRHSHEVFFLHTRSQTDNINNSHHHPSPIEKTRMGLWKLTLWRKETVKARQGSEMATKSAIGEGIAAIGHAKHFRQWMICVLRWWKHRFEKMISTMIPCGLLARKLYTRSRIYMDATELLLYILGPCQSRCFVCDGIPSVSDFAHLLPWTCHSLIKPWNPLDGAHGRPWR